MAPSRAIARRVLHGAALSGTAWALVATSAPNVPARDCFTGLANPDSLEVSVGSVLGAGPGDQSDAASDADGQSLADGGSADAAPLTDAPSDLPEASADASSRADAETDLGGGPAVGPPTCRGIDGVSPGTSLFFSVSQEPRPDGWGECWGYTTHAITPLSGVTLDGTASSSDRVPGDSLFTLASGQFEFHGTGCRGAWSLALQPESGVDAGTLVSPLAASSSNRWLLSRTIEVAEAQLCGGAFDASDAITCSDTFVVSKIVEAR